MVVVVVVVVQLLFLFCSENNGQAFFRTPLFSLFNDVGLFSLFLMSDFMSWVE